MNIWIHPAFHTAAARSALANGIPAVTCLHISLGATLHPTRPHTTTTVVLCHVHGLACTYSPYICCTHTVDQLGPYPQHNMHSLDSHTARMMVSAEAHSRPSTLEPTHGPKRGLGMYHMQQWCPPWEDCSASMQQTFHALNHLATICTLGPVLSIARIAPQQEAGACLRIVNVQTACITQVNVHHLMVTMVLLDHGTACTVACTAWAWASVAERYVLPSCTSQPSSACKRPLQGANQAVKRFEVLGHTWHR
mmetsp:Transcript_6399/g.14238  ORF Transcript_6399/g.14238 Transcript_6399/m.14238 type:complete len:251 (+) Transcript_6399:134-886(+)